jgi:hypothetical protein
VTDTSSGTFPSRLPGQTSFETIHSGETKVLEMITKGRPLIEVRNALTGFIESQAEGLIVL